MAKVTTQLFGDLAIIPREAERPVRETLEFLTDVRESYNGKEQRAQLRTKARHTYSYNVPLQAWHTAAAFNTLYGAIRQRWAVPIWTEAQYVGTVNQTSSLIECDTQNYDLRNESLALLYAGCDKWQIVEISTVEATHINILTDNARFVGAWLIPVRLGRIANNVDMPTNGYNGKYTVQFEIQDTAPLAEFVPDQYAENDIYYEAGLLSGDDVARSIEQHQDKNDFDLGKVEYRTNWTNARVATPYRRLLQGASEVRNFKRFLYRRAGKFRSFWMPSFTADLTVLNTGQVTSSITVASDSYKDYASNRTHIAIQTLNGAWILRTITTATQIDGNSVQLFLSLALNIRAETIYRVCYLGLHRFDADRIELNWIGNNAVESEVRILELTP